MLDDIRILAGPDTDRLPELKARTTQASDMLARMVSAAWVQPVHQLFCQALRLTCGAETVRHQAWGLSGANMGVTWDAASAVTGSLMLFECASKDLDPSLRLPKLLCPLLVRPDSSARQTSRRSSTPSNRSRDTPTLGAHVKRQSSYRHRPQPKNSARTLEDFLVRNEPPGAVLVLPELVTRDDWYRRQHACLVDAPLLLSPAERQVSATAASKEALDEATPPFQLRPGLISAILDFYDALMRHQCSIDAFERLLIEDLASNADVDRGARRLLRQTRFLAAMFRAYRRRIERANRLDEHELRRLLLLPEHKSAYKQVVVTVPDWAADPTGLWPADFDLLTRLPGLEQIDIVTTEAMLVAGLDKRLTDLPPEINELRVEDSASRPPILIAPDVTPPRPHFMWRDREEELLAIVRVLKAQTAATQQPVVDETVAIIFKQPLPYLYLARQLLQSSGVPFETHNTLPLAAEPYAAAVEMISVVVGNNYSRASLITLLHSPHFHFNHEGRRVESEGIETLDRRLRAIRYTGGHDALARLAATWDEMAAGETEPARSEIRRAAPALAVATNLAAELCSLEGLTPASNLLGTLLSFLRRYAAPLDPTAVYAERAVRARTAIWQSIDELQQAHKLLSDADPPTTFAEAVAMVRRRIESQTFDPNIGTGGVQLMDAQAVTYGRFRELFFVGLIEGEWPDRPDHNIFYPASMLASLGWPRERDRLRNARARFGDLIRLPSKRVSLLTFTLEDDVAATPQVCLRTCLM